MNTTLKGSALKKNIINNVKELPPMPGILMKAREVLDSPTAGFKELANIVKTDQALGIKLLRLANSAYYSRRNRISSLKDAAVILGFQTLSEIIFIASASRHMNKELPGYGLSTGAIWRHSLAVAFIAKIIANKSQPEIGYEAFSAGLIHDSGKIILDPYILENKQEFNACMEEEGNTHFEAEKKVLGFDHATIAALIGKRWNFPNHIIQGIRYHHNPSRFRGGKLSLILFIADCIALWGDSKTTYYSADVVGQRMEKRGFDLDQLESLLKEVIDIGVFDYINEMENNLIT